MLKNYFKIAIAVLKRRKFFTFISLFGISFTLTILIVLTAFLDHLISPQYPDTKRNRSLYITVAQMEDDKKGYYSNGPLSYYFLDKYVHSLKTPEKVAISSIFTPTNTYVNNKKLVINVKYTNVEFWDVHDFAFLEGRSYTDQEITNGDRVAVITEKTKLAYFGEASAVGKYIETDNVKYRVAGVVKNVPITILFSYGDMFLPYTLAKTDRNNKEYSGMYTGMILAKSKADLPRIQEEYRQVVAKVPLEGKEYNKFYSNADTYLASFTRTMFGKEQDSGKSKFIMWVGIFALFFMLLPTLNLININISRIMERSSEIGVRKAFGASSKTLVYQFIIENIILTLIGGILGIVFSVIILAVINNSELLPNVILTVNITVLAWALLICLVFGLFSGVYPAWRMSRLQVVAALKAQ
jgi:putative ABC transport system permease protein